MDESCMTVTKQKKSMSVKEMGELLGLKKVESYWLIKKNFFETREVSGVLRVMIDSFEEWYAEQFHYKKTNGPPPGSKFGEVLSIQQIADACSLRIGEMLGLTWDCIEISDVSINSNESYIIVNKELQRVNKEVMEKLGEKDVIKKFPAVFSRNTTVLVLKTPKTTSSVRKIYLPKMVALMLSKRYDDIQELIDLFGEEYFDYNLTFHRSPVR